MANMHKLPVRGLRGIENELVERFDAEARERHADRSAVTRALWAWWLGDLDELPPHLTRCGDSDDETPTP